MTWGDLVFVFLTVASRKAGVNGKIIIIRVVCPKSLGQGSNTLGFWTETEIKGHA